MAGVRAGTFHALVQTTDGQLYAFGRGRDGQLGNGRTVSGVGPVAGMSDVVSFAAGIVAKVREIPRRTGHAQEGYDGLAIVAIDCANDGAPVRLVRGPPAPPPGDIHHYDSMIARVAAEYDTTFVNV